VRLATRPAGGDTGEPLTLQVGDLGGRKDAHLSSPVQGFSLDENNDPVLTFDTPTQSVVVRH
jgi:hypothetical protein